MLLVDILTPSMCVCPDSVPSEVFRLKISNQDSRHTSNQILKRLIFHQGLLKGELVY